jgi:hypothetical protein
MAMYRKNHPINDLSPALGKGIDQQYQYALITLFENCIDDWENELAIVQEESYEQAVTVFCDNYMDEF